VSEFPGLLDAKNILEAGCGAGNTAFPLLDSLPLAHIYACDFASNAVALVQKHPLYKEGRVTAFAADLTQDNLSHWIKPHSVDACMMIFVLSAISPEAMVTALRNVAQVLKPGVGQVFFRDYAAGDLAEMRFSAVKGRQQHLGGRFFARSDGTRAFYFEERVVCTLFEQSGFECAHISTLERDQENRTRGITMKRRFCQGIFTVSSDNNQRNWYPFAPAATERKLTIKETLTLDPAVCDMEVINFECGFLKLKLNIPLTLHAKYS